MDQRTDQRTHRLAPEPDLDERLPAPPDGAEELVDADEEMPRFQVTRRHALVAGISVLAIVAFLYFVLPQLAGLEDTWHRIEQGDPWWLAAALVFEALSIWAYVAMFRTVCAPTERRIEWRESYLITMAGLAATRLFAAGGAGGVALTAWALRRAGIAARDVAERMVAFVVLMYGVYGVALVVGGMGLRTGLFPGEAPFAVTVLPAILGGAALAVALLVSLVPGDVEHRLAAWGRGYRRRALWARRLVRGPASFASGVRLAWRLVRSGDPGLLATIGWWGFNIAVLWASFRAFGEAPPVAILVMGYFVGMLGNLLPLPGGVGGVDGGMIGAFVAFGVDFGLAAVAVLVYRGFAFWLPTIPGIVAYVQLRRTVREWRAQPAEA